MKLKRILAVPLVLIVAGVALAACGSDSSKVEVNDVWARTTAPGQSTGAIYAELKGGDQADRLTAVSVPSEIAAKAEIHESMPAEDSTADHDSMADQSGDHAGDEHMSDGDTSTSSDMDDQADEHGDDAMPTDHGNMVMEQVEGIDIPAGESVMLEPGGFHIMLFDLAKPLASGDTVPVTLTFEQAGEIEVDAKVRDQ